MQIKLYMEFIGCGHPTTAAIWLLELNNNFLWCLPVYQNPWAPPLASSTVLSFYSMVPICYQVRTTIFLDAKCIFHARGVIVWPCRPAEAACYSKWLWVAVVSFWPRIRNGVTLETRRERKVKLYSFHRKKSTIAPSSKMNQPARMFYKLDFRL